MARRTFPDEGSRLVYAISGGALRSSVSTQMKVYTDSGATALADIQTTGGVTISGSVLTVDSGSQLPLFLGPSTGVDTLYVKKADGTGSVSTIYARTDDRLDTVEARATISVSDRGLWVSPGGSDSNDGLSAGAAKATLQAAVNAIPTTGARGGQITLLGGTHTISTTVTIGNPGLVVEGIGGISYNEGEEQLRGTTLLGDAGVNIIEYNASAASLIQAGPTFRNLNFRESGGGKTATLLTIGAANRWRVERCSFRGALTGLKLDAGAAAGLDISWGMLEQCHFSVNTTGLSVPRGTGLTTVIGGEFTGNTTGISVLPLNSLSGEMLVIGVKFDGATTGISTKSRGFRAISNGFENCTTGIAFAVDTNLHANSGQFCVAAQNYFEGVASGDTGISIGSGCLQTLLVGNMYANVATPVTDSGTSTTRIENDFVKTGKYMRFPEVTAPGALTNEALVYAQDNGSGKTQLMVRFPTGSAQQISIEP